MNTTYNEGHLSTFSFSKSAVDVQPATWSKTMGVAGWALYGFMAALMVIPCAEANPVDGSVAQGNAQITYGQTTTINQTTDKAVINWESFSIGADEITQFIQPSSRSVVLNRVVGKGGAIPEASQILGQLKANGQVMLINPSGILFGAGAQVDVAGLVATTANIADDDFMAGRYQFSQASSSNKYVINNGTINVADSGLVALVAPGVENNGVINARLSKVALASGNEFTIDMYGDQLINFGINTKVLSTPVDANGDPLPNAVANKGSIIADGGTIQMSAQTAHGIVDNVISMDGIAQARRVSVRNGTIILAGGDEGWVNVGGTISEGLNNNFNVEMMANSGYTSGNTEQTIDIRGTITTSGGDVTIINNNGDISISGTIDVSGSVGARGIDGHMNGINGVFGSDGNDGADSGDIYIEAIAGGNITISGVLRADGGMGGAGGDGSTADPPGETVNNSLYPGNGGDGGDGGDITIQSIWGDAQFSGATISAQGGQGGAGGNVQSVAIPNVLGGYGGQGGQANSLVISIGGYQGLTIDDTTRININGGVGGDGGVGGSATYTLSVYGVGGNGGEAMLFGHLTLPANFFTTIFTQDKGAIGSGLAQNAPSEYAVDGVTYLSGTYTAPNFNLIQKTFLLLGDSRFMTTDGGDINLVDTTINTQLDNKKLYLTASGSIVIDVDSLISYNDYKNLNVYITANNNYQFGASLQAIDIDGSIETNGSLVSILNNAGNITIDGVIDSSYYSVAADGQGLSVTGDAGQIAIEATSGEITITDDAKLLAVGGTGGNSGDIYLAGNFSFASNFFDEILQIGESVGGGTAGEIYISGILTSGNFIFENIVHIAGATTINSSDNIIFNKGIFGPDDLELNAGSNGLIYFTGIEETSPLTNLIVNSGQMVIFASDFNVSRSMLFSIPVDFASTGDYSLSAGYGFAGDAIGTIAFGSTIIGSNGTLNLDLTADKIVFRDQVGTNSGIDTLKLHQVQEVDIYHAINATTFATDSIFPVTFYMGSTNALFADVNKIIRAGDTLLVSTGDYSNQGVLEFDIPITLKALGDGVSLLGFNIDPTFDTSYQMYMAGTWNTKLGVYIYQDIQLLDDVTFNAYHPDSTVAGSVTLKGKVDGAYAININVEANATIANDIGSKIPIKSLAVGQYSDNGLLTLSGNIIATGTAGNASGAGFYEIDNRVVGDITFDLPVRLNSDVTLTAYGFSGNSGVVFNKILYGTWDLTVNVPYSKLVFNDVVGGIEKLVDLRVVNAENIKGQKAIYVNSFTQETGRGATYFNGAGLIADGDITIRTHIYNGLSLGDDTLFIGAQSVTGYVTARSSLYVGGFNGGAKFGTVNSVGGPLAAQLVRLVDGASGMFFFNGCLVGGDCILPSIVTPNFDIMPYITALQDRTVEMVNECSFNPGANGKRKNNSGNGSCISIQLKDEQSVAEGFI